MGFCCAYVFFIKENLSEILFQAWGIRVNSIWFALMQFFLFIGLCWVRRIEIFAKTHVFADVMIVVTLIIIIVYASLQIKDHGP